MLGSLDYRSGAVDDGADPYHPDGSGEAAGRATLASTPVRRLAAPVLALALACLAPLATAFAAEPPTPSEESAVRALAAAAEALGPDPGRPPERGASVALAALADALPALSGQQRRRARALLARPTDGPDDQLGDGYRVPPEEIRHAATEEGNFCLTWARSGGDAPDRTDGNGSGVPDYVEAIGEIAELSYAVQVGELGWRSPKPDRREECGRPGQTDIYLKELGSLGLFGYAAPDPGQGGARSKHGYLVIDNDYAGRAFARFEEPLDAARVTIAHEFNHLLQEAYNSHLDPWMFEATATWMEEKVHPDINDYLNYLSHFARAPGIPITDFDAGGGLKVYGSAVWNHWLEGGDGRHGSEVLRRAWAVPGAPPAFAIAAYGRALWGSSRASLAREFVRFAATTAEWRTGVGGFPDAGAYPDMRREGRLAPGRDAARAFRLDHTAYRLLRVPRVAAGRVRLAVRAQRGVRAGIALVARRGVADGQVIRKVKFMPRGGRASVALRSPRRNERITAVVVNADARINGYSQRVGDWRYRKDNQRFRARLISSR
jgi:hypothetical protein